MKDLKAFGRRRVLLTIWLNALQMRSFSIYTTSQGPKCKISFTLQVPTYYTLVHVLEFSTNSRKF